VSPGWIQSIGKMGPETGIGTFSRVEGSVFCEPSRPEKKTKGVPKRSPAYFPYFFFERQFAVSNKKQQRVFYVHSYSERRSLGESTLEP